MTGHDHTLSLLISTTLLMLTIPGVALFYGGMVRKKNVINTMGLPLLALALVSVVWVVAGGAAVAGGREVGIVASTTGPLDRLCDVIPAALALALVAGALVERMRVSFFLLFGSLWVAGVYAPVAYGVWGGGWLTKFGTLDFAGGAVIHITAGVSALVAALLVGPRVGFGRTEMIPHALPLSICGVGFLWIGWFGFAGSSRVASITEATIAVVSIQASACAAALSWTIAEWLQRDKPTALGTVSGAVAGLVAIAPAAPYVGPLAALVIGVGAGGACYMAVNFVKPILGYDDSLDVFGMHAVGGTWGMIAAGLFASTGINPNGSDGLFFGYPYQFFAQCVAVIATWAFAVGMTVVLVKGLQFVLSARVEVDAELLGLDLSQHGEKGYS